MKYKRNKKKPVRQQSADTQFFSPQIKINSKKDPDSPGIKVSSPSDKSEKQADAIADRVVSMSGHNQAKESPGIRTMEDKSSFTRAAEDKEEPAAKLQRQAEQEEELAAKLVQQQNEEEDPAAKIQREAEQEEELATMLQREAEQEEEPAAKLDNTLIQNRPEQTNSDLSKAKGKTSKADLDKMIIETKGSGVPLPNDIRTEMEGKFQADFSQVRIHTGEKASYMSNMLHAKAFTHGYDIYFNSGQYLPYSSSGKHLLAHELTHVVQQKGNGR